jgi:hypothetical protein
MADLQLSREGPAFGEIEIIGMELAATSPTGVETELEMHGVKRTLPWFRNGADQRIRVTVHTSNGDITLGGPLRPGNYQTY